MNDLIPMGPNQKDIAEMARLRSIMEGNHVPAIREPVQAQYVNNGTRPLHESYVPPAPAYVPGGSPSREDVDAMKSLLEKINNLSSDDTVKKSPALMETKITPSQSSESPSYEVLISLKESSSGKEVRSYSVVDQNRRDVASNLSLRESAQSLMKLMNKGYDFESKRVQEVLELEEEYNRNKLDASRHKSRYNRSMELGETAAAGVFKERFGIARANALAAQDQIKSILESIR